MEAHFKCARQSYLGGDYDQCEALLSLLSGA